MQAFVAQINFLFTYFELGRGYAPIFYLFLTKITKNSTRPVLKPARGRASLALPRAGSHIFRASQKFSQKFFCFSLQSEPQYGILSCGLSQSPGIKTMSGLETWPVGQEVKTPPFHGGNRGSSPLRVTNAVLAEPFAYHFDKRRVRLFLLFAFSRKRFQFCLKHGFQSGDAVDHSDRHAVESKQFFGRSSLHGDNRLNLFPLGV